MEPVVLRVDAKHPVPRKLKDVICFFCFIIVPVVLAGHFKAKEEKAEANE